MNMPTSSYVNFESNINKILKIFFYIRYIIVEIKTSDQINENFSKRRKFNMSETLSLIFFREDKRQKITRLMDLFIIECMT